MNLSSVYQRLRPSKIFQSVDQRLSRKLLGHGAGFSNHLKGQKEIRQAKKIPTSTISPLKIKGFAQIPDLDVSEIQKLWPSVIKDAEWTSVASQQISHPEEKLPLEGLITKDVLDHFREYFGTEVDVWSVVCWRNHGPKQEDREKHVFSNWWHFDQAPTSIAKLFIAVSDITEDDGPFHIYPIRRSKELIRQGYIDRRNYGGAPVDDYPGLYKMIGKAGTAVICNTEICLHKAGMPEEGRSRDIIQFQIIPAQEYTGLKNLAAKGVDRR